MSGNGPAWGARLLDGERARFGVWAHGTEELFLRLNGEDRPMRRESDGWFTAEAEGVGAGAPYAFVLPGGLAVPDPASRRQEGDVHGFSLLTDPDAYAWRNPDWRGRAWEESVVYELHVGTFTPEGTFAAAREKLSHLSELGVTMVELMPLAQFGGRRGWGYDGVLLYAPHNAYGTPDELKAFVDEAHGLGIGVVLDVVYNHLGPDGNYLPGLAPDFFHPERMTPWGGAIAYEKRPVRDFFIGNALYWLDEFRFDGLRLDAVDHIRDPAEPDILVELARRVHAAFPGRPIHLTTEDNRNITALHERGPGGEVVLYSGEWNDDLHNAAHVLASGETEAYYEDFADDPLRHVARVLAEGFAYQGEASRHEGNAARGRPSGHLPPQAFVDFLQNHDQVGNRALGERLITLTDPDTLRVLSAALLLSPHIPLLFMGEEWGETNPFFFFTDFHDELADIVREGRRREFAKFAAYTGHRPDEIPDPNAVSTFERSRIDWGKRDTAEGQDWLGWTRRLLTLRQAHVVPALKRAAGHAGTLLKAQDGVIAVDWRLGSTLLQLRAAFGPSPGAVPALRGETIFRYPEKAGGGPGIAVAVAAATTAEPEGGRPA